MNLLIIKGFLKGVVDLNANIARKNIYLREILKINFFFFEDYKSIQD